MSLAQMTQYDFDIPTKFKSKRNAPNSTSTPTDNKSKSNKASPIPNANPSMNARGASPNVHSPNAGKSEMSQEMKKNQSLIKTYVNEFGKEILSWRYIDTQLELVIDALMNLTTKYQSMTSIASGDVIQTPVSALFQDARYGDLRQLLTFQMLQEREDLVAQLKKLISHMGDVSIAMNQTNIYCTQMMQNASPSLLYNPPMNPNPSESGFCSKQESIGSDEAAVDMISPNKLHLRPKPIIGLQAPVVLKTPKKQHLNASALPPTPPSNSNLHNPKLNFIFTIEHLLKIIDLSSLYILETKLKSDLIKSYFEGLSQRGIFAVEVNRLLGDAWKVYNANDSDMKKCFSHIDESAGKEVAC